MHLQVDAWLDRADGWLRILDVDSGHELLRFDRRQIRAALDRGDLHPGTLLDATLADADILQLVADLGSAA